MANPSPRSADVTVANRSAARWAALKQIFEFILCSALCVGLMHLVNRLELPFARSMVRCGSPVLPGQFTGSVHCGDALQVTNEGMKISARGQTYEHAFRLVALLFAGSIADSRGRRPVVIAGALFVTISILLLALAALVPACGVLCFTVAQGFQGAAPFSMIGPVIYGDLALRPGADAQAIFWVAHVTQSVVQVLVVTLAISFQLPGLEIQRFEVVWGVALLLAMLLTYLCICVCKETQPARVTVTEASLSGVLTSVRTEVSSYGALVRQNDLLRATLQRDVFTKFSENSPFVVSAAMALYGYTLPQVVVRFWGLQFWLMGWSIAAPQIICRYGEQRTFLLARIWTQSVHIISTFVVPLSAVGLWSMEYGAKIGYCISGLEQQIWAKCFPQEHRSKSMALVALLQEVMFSAASYTYSLLFNAKATSYMGKGLPFFVATACRVVAFAIFWSQLWPLYRRAADEINQERVMKDALLKKNK